MTWSKRVEATVWCDVSGCGELATGWGSVGTIRKNLKEQRWRHTSIDGTGVDVCPNHPEPMYALMHNNVFEGVS